MIEHEQEIRARRAGPFCADSRTDCLAVYDDLGSMICLLDEARAQIARLEQERQAIQNDRNRRSSDDERERARAS